MTKIKLYRLLLCFFLLQVVSFTANAQCPNVTISATSTPATCYNNGTITVTISGEDINKLALDSAEFKLEPISGGNIVDWTPTWTGSGVTKIYNQAVSGTYRLEMRAFCKISQQTTIYSAAADVTVEGNYTPLIISATTSRKSMSCRPTGEIKMNLTSGKTPYNVIVMAPSGFTGSTNFSTSNPTYTFSNTPAGDYTIKVTDACNYTSILTFNSPAISKDVVQNLYNIMSREINSTDCKSIAPYTINSVSDVSETYYWNRPGEYYEYCYLLNGTNRTDWKPLTTKTPAYILPSNYSTFCDSENTLKSCIRPIGCTNESEEWIQHTFNYLCSGSIYTSFTDGSTCSTVKVSAWIPSYHGLCYDTSWKLESISSSNTIIQQGILTASNLTLFSKLELPRNSRYQITATDRDNKTVTSIFTPDNPGQFFYSWGGRSNSQCFFDYYYFQERDSEVIAQGTKFIYLSGPMQTLPCGISIGESYTIPEGWGSFFSWASSDPKLPSTTYMKPVPYGTYEFNIINNCGTIVKAFFIVSTYNNDPLTYTAEQTCNGLKVIPAGRIKSTDYLGVVKPYTTYYRIISGPSGVAYNTVGVLPGEALILPSPGTYKIGMTYDQTGTCYCDIITIDYPGQGLYIDPTATSAYVCEGSTTGRIYVQATNGVPPYTYTVTSAPGTPEITYQTNQTGEFPSIGTTGGTYNIEVKDACNTFFTLPVTMIDIVNANIAYIGADETGRFFEGEEININSIALGRDAKYEWRKDSDPTVIFTGQQPRPIAVYPTSSGMYKVTVTPTGCPAPITRGLKIVVFPPPGQAIELPLDSCRTYSIRYELPENYAGNNAKLEWSTPNDPTRRVIPACNLSSGTQCKEALPDNDCSLKNNLPERIDICTAGQSVRLDAYTKNAALYKWSYKNATSWAIEVDKPGTYTVTITPKNKNCSSVTQSVTVGSVDEACLTMSGSDAALNMCTGDAVQLSVPACGVSYSWSPTSYLSNPTIANPIASPPASTTYSVAITTAGGCKVNKTVHVNVGAPFELETGDKGNVLYECKGKKITLSVSGADDYRWYPKDGLSCYDCSKPEYIVLGNKTYTVSGIKNGCMASKTVVITQKPDEVFFTYTKSDCKVSFEATNDNNEYSNYTWTFGDGQTGTGRTTSNDYSMHGIYNVCVEATNACGVRMSRCMPITITSDECICKLKNCP